MGGKSRQEKNKEKLYDQQFFKSSRCSLNQ